METAQAGSEEAARKAFLPTVVRRGSPLDAGPSRIGWCCSLVAGGCAVTVGSTRLYGSRRSAASPDGAHFGGEPAGGDPADAAPGDVGLVRRRGGPGRRAAGVPQSVRGAGRHPLVPAAAAR